VRLGLVVPQPFFSIEKQQPTPRFSFFFLIYAGTRSGNVLQFFIK